MSDPLAPPVEPEQPPDQGRPHPPLPILLLTAERFAGH